MIGKLVPHVKEPDASARKLTLHRLISDAAEHFTTFAGGITHMQNKVAKTLEIELIILRGHLDTPAADSPGKLEGYEPFVPHTQLEETRVILATRGCNSL
jgi:hypothetical protein